MAQCVFEEIEQTIKVWVRQRSRIRARKSILRRPIAEGDSGGTEAGAGEDDVERILIRVVAILSRAYTPKSCSSAATSAMNWPAKPG